MKELNIELNRFAELCAKVRRDWGVQIGGPASEPGYPSVNVEGVDRYHIFYHADCGAMIFWLLDEFPTVGYRVLPHALGTTVYSNRPPGVGLSVNVSESWSLHHASLYVLLKSVNAILEQDAR